MPHENSGLIIVATPIGNLGDITYRAIDYLRRCDLILCEDTRQSAKLLNHYGINTKTISYNEHNAEARHQYILQLLSENKLICLISDAGTPLISDPGNRLVRVVLEHGYKVTTAPGVSSPITALSISGLEADKFLFLGFLDSKISKVKAELEQYQQFAGVIVFFESPKRINRTLEVIAEIYPNSKCVVARELTKLYEEIISGRAGDLCLRDYRGELVVMIESRPVAKEYSEEEIIRMLSQNMDKGEIAKLCGLPKRRIYEISLKMKGDG